jgi:hypothetical protein
MDRDMDRDRSRYSSWRGERAFLISEINLGELRTEQYNTSTKSEITL